jgi:hypothetical protein
MRNYELAVPDLQGAFEVTTPISAISPERRKSLENLYVASYGAIRDIAASESSLLVQDIDSITDGVARYLDQYEGPAEPSVFLCWATGIAHEAIEQLKWFYAAQRDHSLIVYSGIWAVLRGCSDLGATDYEVELLSQTTWVKVLLDLSRWQKPGTAKLSTRLREFAHSQALGWRTERLRACGRYVDKRGTKRTSSKNKSTKSSKTEKKIAA